MIDKKKIHQLINKIDELPETKISKGGDFQYTLIEYAEVMVIITSIFDEELNN